MATAANITINDGAASPVAHTFYYVPLPNNVSSFEDRVSGVMLGYNRITMWINRPLPNRNSKTVANRNVRVILKVETPKLESLGTADNGIMPPPTLSYKPLAQVEFSLPERCSLQDRKDLLAYVRNVLSNAQVISIVQDFEQPY